MNLSGVDVKLIIYFGNGTALSRTDETIEVVIPFGGDLPLENIKEAICEIESGNDLWLAAKSIDRNSNESPFSSAAVFKYRRFHVKSNESIELSDDVETLKIVMEQKPKGIENSGNFFKGISKNTWIAIGSVFASTAIVLFAIIKCCKHACKRRKERKKIREEQQNGRITGPSSGVPSTKSPPTVIRKKKKTKKKKVFKKKDGRVSSDE